MTRKSLGLLIPVLFAIGCSAFNSSAHAQVPRGDEFGPHFLFSSGITGCLTVIDGELLVRDPCNSLPESRVEIMSGLFSDQAHSVLRIKLTPGKFLILTVTLPNPLIALPVLPQKVIANPTGIPNTIWRVTAPDPNGFRSVVAVFDAPGALCMQPRPRPDGSTDVVINECDGRRIWKLEPVPAPFPPRSQ